MITTKRLNIEDKPAYFFNDMININDLDVKLILINEFTIFENGSVIFDISCCKENNTPHVVFNDVECILKKEKEERKKYCLLKMKREILSWLRIS